MSEPVSIEQSNAAVDMKKIKKKKKKKKRKKEKKLDADPTGTHTGEEAGVRTVEGSDNQNSNGPTDAEDIFNNYHCADAGMLDSSHIPAPTGQSSSDEEEKKPSPDVFESSSFPLEIPDDSPSTKIKPDDEPSVTRIGSEEFPLQNLASAFDSAVVGDEKGETTPEAESNNTKFAVINSNSVREESNEWEQKNTKVVQGVKLAKQRSLEAIQKEREAEAQREAQVYKRREEVQRRTQDLDAKLRPHAATYKRRNVPTIAELRAVAKKEEKPKFFATFGKRTKAEMIAKRERELMYGDNGTSISGDISMTQSVYDDNISSSVISAAKDMQASSSSTSSAIRKVSPLKVQKKKNHQLSMLTGSLPEPPPGPPLQDSDTIVINVGGTDFTTLVRTLCKYRSSILCRYCKGKEKPVYTATGALFFDADPDCFDYILRFYRTGKTFISKDDKMYPMVVNAAEYFGVRQYMFPAPKKKIQDKPQDVKKNEQGSLNAGKGMHKGYSFGTGRRLDEKAVGGSHEISPVKRKKTKTYNFKFNVMGLSDQVTFTVPKYSKLILVGAEGFGRLMVDVLDNSKRYQLRGGILYDSNLYFWKNGAKVTFNSISANDESIESENGDNVSLANTFPGGFQYHIYLAKPNADAEALKMINVGLELYVKSIHNNIRGEETTSPFKLPAMKESKSLPLIEGRNTKVEGIRTGFF